MLTGIIAIALFPKISGDTATLSGAVFDHSKVAMVDEMIRSGLPPGNPFFGEAGHETPLVYYYLWHYSAAELALVFGVTGWEADIAMTAVTAFSSLSLMIGLAVWISGRPLAGVLVTVLAFAGSLYPVLEFTLTRDRFYSYFLPSTGFSGWLFQSTWAPQHVASASSVVVACYLLIWLARRPSVLLVAVLALVTTAGYQSSTWVGGITFALAAPIIGVVLLASCAPAQRRSFAFSAIASGLLAVALAFPFLHDQFAAIASRGIAGPIALDVHDTFNKLSIAEPWRSVLDIPGYWLAFLPIEFPAIYFAGLWSLAGGLRSTKKADRQVVQVFAALAFVSLMVAGYTTITFSHNNDLGWRAVLPGVFVLTIFSAALLSRLPTRPLGWPVTAAIVLVLLGLPRSFQILTENVGGTPSPSARTFAATPAMWAAVRRHSDANERIANNPLFMSAMTPWPINISWALLGNRRSCFAGPEFAPFTSLPRETVAVIDRQFARIFQEGSSADIPDLAHRYQCTVAVLTAEDGAWQKDPFADSGLYKLADESPGRWKIYRLIAAPRL